MSNERTEWRATLVTVGLAFACSGGTADDAADPQACGSVSVSACESDDCTTSTATTWDAERSCVSERRAFCVVDDDCDGAFVLARDADGTPWWFPSSCIPTGFEVVSAPDETAQAARGWPDCT